MIDKKLLQLPGIKKILGLLAGSAVLQAIFIIGQAFGLALTITHLWNGAKLGGNWRGLRCFLFPLPCAI